MPRIRQITETRKDTVNASTTYEGSYAGVLTDSAQQDADPMWQVTRKNTLGSVLSTSIASGGAFDQVWNDRETLFPVPVFANEKSLLFDGVDEYIDLGDNFTFGPGVAFTWSIWFNANNFAAQRTLLAKTTVDTNVYGYSLQHTSAGKLYIQVRASGTLRVNTFPGIMTAGVWNHVVLTYSGSSNMSGFTAYLNGAALSSPGNSALNAWVVPDNFSIGRRGSIGYFSGNINQVAVWNKELSGAEVLETYNAGIPADLKLQSPAASLQSYYHLNSDLSFPSEIDQQGSVNGTLTNMELADYVLDVP